MENQKELIEQVTLKAKAWLSNDYDAETRAEVERMLNADDKTELIESFYKDLEFGTGGLRGIMGAGTNRMNIYTVGAATQGLANYLKEAFADLPQISVAVGHDVRTTRANLPKSLPTSSRPTASRYISSTASAPPPSSRSPSATSDARAASTSPPRTTPRSTTATRHTGRTALRSSPPTTSTSSTTSTASRASRTSNLKATRTTSKSSARKSTTHSSMQSKPCRSIPRSSNVTRTSR